MVKFASWIWNPDVFQEFASASHLQVIQWTSFSHGFPLWTWELADTNPRVFPMCKKEWMMNGSEITYSASFSLHYILSPPLVTHSAARVCMYYTHRYAVVYFNFFFFLNAFWLVRFFFHVDGPFLGLFNHHHCCCMDHDNLLWDDRTSAHTKHIPSETSQ